MTFIAVSIGQIFHAVPDAAGGLPLDDYASILACLEKIEKLETLKWKRMEGKVVDTAITIVRERTWCGKVEEDWACFV